MDISRILATVTRINDLLKALPPSTKVAKNSSLLVPREMVGHLRRKALEDTLPFLKSIIAGIKAEQERYNDLYFDEVNGRQEFAVNQIHHLKCSMEKEFDRKKIDQVRDILNEIEHYEQIEAKSNSKIYIEKELTSRIFRLLSSVDIKPTDSYIGEYLRRRVHFSCDFPSNIEMSTLRTMLRLLQCPDSASVHRGD